MAEPEVEPAGSDDRAQRAAIEHMMQEWAAVARDIIRRRRQS